MKIVLQDRIKHLEQTVDNTKAKTNLKNLKDTSKLSYVTRRYKNKFFKQLISSPEEQGVNEAVKGLNGIVDDLRKNPKLIDNLESLEKRAEEIISKAPEEAEEYLYNEFYKIIKQAGEINDTKTTSKQDLLKRLKERLKIAQEEYKNLGENRYNQTYDRGIKAEEAKLNKLKQEYAALEADIIPEIHIQIDKNTKNPYAVLRSELEHARDIAKREVPNQDEKHFARYKGKNESEMSLSYVKKKADTRAAKNTTEKNLDKINKKYDFEDVPSDVKDFDPSKQPMNKIIVKSKDGKELGHIEYDDSVLPDTIFIGDMQNYKIERGAARAAVAKLIEKYPDKQISWVSISEGSTKSYKEFCKEYPELAKRVQFEDRTGNLNNLLNPDLSENTREAILDELFNDGYNSEKGVIADETKVHNSEQSARSTGDVRRNIGERSGQYREAAARGDIQQPERESSNISHDTDSPSNSNVESFKEGISSNNNQSKQENIQSGIRGETEQSPTDRLVNSNGNIEEIAKALDDTALKLDPQTFKNLGDNADAYYNVLKNGGVEDLTGIKEAFAQGDINYVRYKYLKLTK